MKFSLLLLLPVYDSQSTIKIVPLMVEPPSARDDDNDG